MIYLDNHATTRVDPRVIEAMAPCFSEIYGNPASRNHRFGWRAEAAVAKGREQVAALIGASPREIVFTSGATESVNLAIKGVAERASGDKNHIITCETEHKAVLDCCTRLETQGFQVTQLAVDTDGLLDADRVRDAITDNTILISVMYANNEIGVIQPIPEIGRMARQAGLPFFVDAAQAAGKVSIEVERDGIDLLAISAHKIYGPKGAGALYVRRRGGRVELEPQIDGGGHERGLRSGTLNVPGIVGLGLACELCAAEMEAEAERLAGLRDRLFSALTERLAGVSLNGSQKHRSPNNLNVSFEGVDGESLLRGLDDIAVSSGSACTTAEPEPSYVLRAIGVPDKLANASLRFGLGRFNTEQEIDYAVERVVAAVDRLRQLAV